MCPVRSVTYVSGRSQALAVAQRGYFRPLPAPFAREMHANTSSRSWRWRACLQTSGRPSSRLLPTRFDCVGLLQVPLLRVLVHFPDKRLNAGDGVAQVVRRVGVDSAIAARGLLLRNDRKTRWQGSIGGSGVPRMRSTHRVTHGDLTGSRQRIAANGHQQSWIRFFGWSTWAAVG
jgi:hypothetical protein